MCDPIAMITAAASAASTALGAIQQSQQSGQQRAHYDWLAAQQRNAAAVEEQRAAMAAQEGEAAEAQARARTAQRLGTAQARLAAQGTDLSGSPLELLGDIAAAGAEEMLSLRYRGLRDFWERRLRATDREAEARRLDAAAGRVDPALGSALGPVPGAALGVVRSLLN